MQLKRRLFNCRVWNTGVPTPWRAERWTVPQGRVATACFGPNLTLLFATTGDPATIFSLPLQDNIFDVKKATNNDVKIAMRLIDLTKVNFSSDDDDDYITVGGRIVSMEWDSTGKYLAILFQVCTKINILFLKSQQPIFLGQRCFIEEISNIYIKGHNILSRLIKSIIYDINI